MVASHQNVVSSDSWAALATTLRPLEWKDELISAASDDGNISSSLDARIHNTSGFVACRYRGHLHHRTYHATERTDNVARTSKT